MSTTLFSKHFEDALWTGREPGDGRLWPGDLSPERIVMNLVWINLHSDPLLRKIFGSDAIEMMELRNPFEFRHLPRLQIYLGSIEETQEPTRIAKNIVRIYVGLRYHGDEAFQKALPNKNGADSVVRYVRTLMASNQTLTVALTGRNDSLPMANRSEQDAGVNFILDSDDQANRFAVVQELQWAYHLEVDNETGRIANAMLATKP